MTSILNGRSAGRTALLAVSVLAAAGMAVAPPSARAAIAQATASAPRPPTTDPYAPSYGHPYRNGAVPTRPAYEKMRSWQAAHPDAAPDASSDLAYQGSVDGIGVVIGQPRVYLVFWGSQWGAAGTDGNGNMTLTGDPQGMAPRLQQLFKGVGTDNELWSGVITQYCEGGMAPGVQDCPANAPHVQYPAGGAYAGLWADTSIPAPSAATADQIAAEAVNAAAHFGNTSPASNRDAQYVIVSPTGTHPDGFGTPSGDFCAWHDNTSGGSAGDVEFTNLPYVTDQGPACGANFVNAGSAGALDGVTTTAGHEYAETITDPTFGGWLDSSGNEAADKCVWISRGQGAAADVAMATGSFAMQSIWSNSDNACEISDPIVSDSVGGGGLTAQEPPAGYTWCATEGSTCRFSGTRLVAFGAGAYLYKNATGGITCSNAVFGSDPAPNILKACYVAPAGGPSGFTLCAREGNACSPGGPAVVAFGVNGAFTDRVLSGAPLECTNDNFGGDPAPYSLKACYVAPAGGPGGRWSSCAAENGSCTVVGSQTVAFGASGSFEYGTDSEAFSCTAAAFGADPLYGVAKACYTRSGGPNGFGTRCASEQGTCLFRGFRTVAYGADGSYRYKSFTGRAPCDNTAFGADPIVGAVKACYLTP